MRTAVFSIISSNYGHYAQVLMASVRRQHPEWDRFVLTIGDLPPLRDASFVGIPIDALPLPNARQFEFRYTILELNTAVKPWMLESLFARGYDRVIYFDPDIVLYSRLKELDDNAFLTLTPHLTGFIGGDGHPSERTILQAGTYNLGFLAVTRGAELQRFLGWWQEKLEFQSIVDPARGLFVDQRWMDLAPGLFANVAIVRHDGWNVAYWNLRQRTVKKTVDGFIVNGVPLRFFHFSGFDPSLPGRVSRHDLRLTIEEAADVRLLADDYTTALQRADFKSFQNLPYVFSRFADGTPISDSARTAYRHSHELQVAAGEDPFAHPELFRDAPPQPRARSSRAAWAAWRAYSALARFRPLVLLLPRRVRKAAREFLLGRKDDVVPPPRSGATLPAGLNVVGYVRRETGVGESARLFARSCQRAGLPHAVFDVDASAFGHSPAYRATIFHVNADQTPHVLRAHPQFAADGEYNIGCWHWEMPEFPDEWLASAALLHEIWAPSAFIQSVVSRKVAIPVVHMPHGIEVSEVEPLSPQELGVPAGRFTFLCMFDFRSVMARKNPMGAIDAFRRAFPNGSSRAALLVKTTHGSEHPAELAQLQAKVREADSVVLSDVVLSRARANGLLASSDALVSLHRSEGFGLIPAEAMYLGKPVIATAWSGNVDFMNTTNSCPVKYDLVTLEHTIPPYAAGQQWAEPDLDHAAELMRRVADDADFRARIGSNAAASIRQSFSPAAAGERYRKRLEALGLLAPIR